MTSPLTPDECRAAIDSAAAQAAKSQHAYAVADKRSQELAEQSSAAFEVWQRDVAHLRAVTKQYVEALLSTYDRPTNQPTLGDLS